MNRFKQFVLLAAASLFLAGCQEQTAKTNEPKNHQTEQSTNKEIVIADASAKELVNADAGDLYQKYIGEKSFSKAPDDYRQATDDAIDAYLKSLDRKETKKWDKQKWVQSMTSSLETGYRGGAEDISSYKVVYDKLRLPDGRLLQDVGMNEITKKQDKKVNVALLIDSSGSMKAQVGGESKMALAKKSLERLAKELPDSVHVSLIAFGYKGTGSDADKEMSCKAVDTFYPLQSFNEAKFSDSLSKFNPSGWTPLAASIEMANRQLSDKQGENTENFIYVVSDGIETCGGDPVAAARKAKQEQTNVKINIIGFDVDSKADQQLKQVAEAGGGEYSSVKTKQQLTNIENIWKEAINKNTWRWWAVHNFSSTTWKTVDHYNAMNSFSSKYLAMSNQEENRFLSAMDRLQKEKLIDSDQRSAIINILDSRQKKIKDYLNDLVTKKRTKIKTESNDIDQKLHVIEKQVGI
ncbi:VWA domain-containing protein [Falsibacillus albus]|uniref:VWA domain-containing protein n=1 Tax=Falsibacillus albus TaxID=2478915 RepID=A0A3L7JGU6_9BACI|nr:VWA domain-containing protein [Falsibacillus albus]RLQ90007.1 VWA domain-containing protein [Falsibacillus albus]